MSALCLVFASFIDPTECELIVPNPLLDRLRVPPFLYGTAWKENETRRLTELALQQGFRGIDTANQRKHYFEAAVGEAIANAIARGLVAREGLFLQTKYTFQAGQDHRLPYDPRAPIHQQVEQSFTSSLEHLQVDTLDGYILHGPSRSTGLGRADWEAWQAMEAIQESGRVRFLGVSNVSAEQIQQLHQMARVKPQLVQNRCFAARGWDRRVREFCASHDIIYQGFSLLTANRSVWHGSALARIAQKHGRTPSQIIFRFALEVGMLPLTGTTSANHMREDLEALEFQLTPDDVAAIQALDQ